jgi:hypothetical protein
MRYLFYENEVIEMLHVNKEGGTSSIMRSHRPSLKLKYQDERYRIRLFSGMEANDKRIPWKNLKAVASRICSFSCMYVCMHACFLR